MSAGDDDDRSGEGSASPASQAAADSGADDPWTEVLGAWAAAITLVYLAWRFAGEALAPFLSIAVWVGIPVALHRGRGRTLASQGLAWASLSKTASAVGRAALIFFPLYTIGFFAWVGREGFRMPAASLPVVALVGNLVYAALPEEAFFRGFVQPRLGALYPGPRRRVLGVTLTPGIVLAAALFALTHVAFLPNPFTLEAVLRLATFFPGLVFGALREDTGDVAAPAIFHALCNALLTTLQHGFLT